MSDTLLVNFTNAGKKFEKPMTSDIAQSGVRMRHTSLNATPLPRRALRWLATVHAAQPRVSSPATHTRARSKSLFM